MANMDSYFTSPDLQIFVKVVGDRHSQKHPITVRSWSTVNDVKDVIRTALQVPPSAQRLFYGPLMTSGGELPNHRSLHDAGIDRSGETLMLMMSPTHGSGSEFGSTTSLRSSADVCVSSSMIDSCPRPLRTIVQQARRGLALGLKPELVLDGSGGTYFLRDARKTKVAVFKPADEEPFAENNPRGYLKHIDANESLREGILPGEACLREVAAFLLDHEGFSGVPMTTLAEARHPAFNTNGKLLKLSEGGASLGSHSLNPQSPATSSLKKKVGSFQEFVTTECTMDDLGPSKICADEIHKIAILDIRLMNADRNSANILCRRHEDNSIELVPIDHGYGLRDVCDVSWMDWCWLDWPQLKQPLSKKSRDYILGLDIDADVEMLKEQLNFGGKALDYFRASSKILQAGVKAGLSLYDIAIMCCRNDNAGEVPSKLEVLTTMASELATSAVANGRWNHVAASKALADQLSSTGGSLLENTKDPDSVLHKSVSSVDLVSFGTETHEVPSPVQAGDLPAMTQSTGSDIYSDDDERTADREDCEEWAANVIDASMDNSMSLLRPLMFQKPRSPSVSSDEQSVDRNLSSSPKGFWYTRPNSPSSSSSSPDELDADSISWSPNLSSNNLVDMGRDVGAPGKATCKSPTVAFADSFSGPFLLPPATVNVSSFKPVLDQSRRSGDSSTKTLARSKSFSHLRRSSTISSGESSRLGRGDSEEVKEYFNKFVDLVIVRETTSSSCLAGKQS